MSRAFGINFNPSLAAFPDFSRLFLLGVMFVAGLVTIPQEAQFGPVSGLAVLTILFCAGAWVLWLERPWFPLERWAVLVPLSLFTIYSIGSMLWFKPSVKGLQVLSVTVGFFGLILLAARQTERRPRTAMEIHRMLDIGTFISTALYAASVILYGPGAENFIVARAFALFAMLGVARQLSRWQGGHPRAFFYAVIITAVIFLSISRAAMGAALLMFPLAAMSRLNRRGVATAVAMALIGIGSLVAVLASSQMMYERFFGFDASMNVGGVAINASGRSAMWALLYDSAQNDLMFGQGVGSSSLLIDRYFPGLGHPHNDYLRLLFDFGYVGLLSFSAFLIGAAALLLAQVRHCASATGVTGMVRRPYFLTPLLSLLAVGATMLTDNLLSYSFVMAPLGILIGCAIGLAPSTQKAAAVQMLARARRRPRSRPTPAPHRPQRLRSPGVAAAGRGAA